VILSISAWPTRQQVILGASKHNLLKKLEVEPLNNFPCLGKVTSGADSIGHRGHVPRLYNTVSRRTANKKLTELYWPSRKRSIKWLIVLIEPKKWRGTTNFFSGVARRACAPPHFQIRSGNTESDSRQLLSIILNMLYNNVSGQKNCNCMKSHWIGVIVKN